MTACEKMADTLRLARGALCYEREEGLSGEAFLEMSDRVDEALHAYESEKALLAKTQEWHQHGMIAPSCVGCPTAEAMIERKRFIGVDWRGMFNDLTDEEYAAVFKAKLKEYDADADDGCYLLEDDEMEDIVISYHMALNKKRHEKNLEGSNDGT